MNHSQLTCFITEWVVSSTSCGMYIPEQAPQISSPTGAHGPRLLPPSLERLPPKPLEESLHHTLGRVGGFSAGQNPFGPEAQILTIKNINQYFCIVCCSCPWDSCLNDPTWDYSVTEPPRHISFNPGQRLKLMCSVTVQGAPHDTWVTACPSEDHSQNPAKHCTCLVSLSQTGAGAINKKSQSTQAALYCAHPTLVK